MPQAFQATLAAWQKSNSLTQGFGPGTHMAPTWSHLANRLQNRLFGGIYLVPLALTYPSVFFVGSEEVRFHR